LSVIHARPAGISRGTLGLEPVRLRPRTLSVYQLPRRLRAIGAAPYPAILSRERDDPRDLTYVRTIYVGNSNADIWVRVLFSRLSRPSSE
jgi:hypothetical protein